MSKKIDHKIWEYLLIHSNADPRIKRGEEGGLGVEKKITDDYQFKSCILGQKAGLLTSGRKK